MMHWRMKERVWKFWRRLEDLWKPAEPRGRQGQDLVEYALIVGLIAVACAALIPYTATNTMREIYNRIAIILLNSTNQT